MEFRKLKGAQVNVLNFPIPDVAAGVDIAGRLLMQVPAGYNFIVQKLDIIAHAEAAGVDADNTAVVVVKNGTSTMVSKTFNNTVAFPSAEAMSNLGTIANSVIPASGYLSFYLTNGATADTPQFDLQVQGYFEKVATK